MCPVIKGRNATFPRVSEGFPTVAHRGLSEAWLGLLAEQLASSTSRRWRLSSLQQMGERTMI